MITDISKLSTGDYIENGIFLVSDANTKGTRTGGLVTNLTLQNNTGRIAAVIFDCPLKLTGCGSEVVTVSGAVGNYNGPQVSIRVIGKVPLEKAEALMSELLPPRRTPETQVKKTMKLLIKAIENESLREFVAELVTSGRFWICPAGKTLHHNYIGGLADHSVHTAKIVYSAAHLYPAINKDIALAGAILHDIGKIEEISFGGGFAYTEVGRMQSHMFLGARMVSDLANSDSHKLDDALKNDIIHIILSHHRQLELGAVVQPVTLEAELVAMADLMDSSIEKLSELIQNDSNQGEWTAYSQLLGRSMRKTAATKRDMTDVIDVGIAQQCATGEEPQSPSELSYAKCK